MNKKTSVRQLAAALALSLGAALCSAEEVFLDRIVAIVGENVVMQSELDQRLAEVIGNLKRSGTAVPPKEKLITPVLEQLVSERLLLNFAEDRNISVSDGEVNQTLQGIAAKQKLSLEQFVEAVHQQGESLADLRRNIHNSLLLERIDQLVVMGNIRVSLQEIEQFLASEEAQATNAPEFQLGYILLPLSSGANKTAIKVATQKAEKLIQQLTDGAEFSQLAIANSVADNALQGGDLGWKRLVNLPAKWVPAIRDLQAGEMSKPIRTDAGLNILKVYDRRGGKPQMVLQQHHVRHILLQTNAIRDDEAAYNQLIEVRQRLADGEDFAALAKELSEDPGSKQNGGELGWVTPEEKLMVPEFIQMMDSVDVGEVSYPFRTDLGDRGIGWHILEVTERREKDFGEMATRNQADNFLRQRRFEEEKSIWLQEMRSNTYIKLKL